MHNVYLFIGQSGAGKGTQVTLLEQKLKSIKPEAQMLHLETGAIFRSFIQTGSYTAEKIKEYIDLGILPPSFIGIHVWSHELINQYNGQEIVFLDGTPRVLDEVPVLLSAVKFYNWTLHVIYINVSDSWANERLQGRGRADDLHEDERKARIQWFHDNVIPAVNMLKNSPEVIFIDVNGEQSIQKVHEDICEMLHI